MTYYKAANFTIRNEILLRYVFITFGLRWAASFRWYLWDFDTFCQKKRIIISYIDAHYHQCIIAQSISKWNRPILVKIGRWLRRADGIGNVGQCYKWNFKMKQCGKMRPWNEDAGYFSRYIMHIKSYFTINTPYEIYASRNNMSSIIILFIDYFRNVK